MGMHETMLIKISASCFLISIHAFAQSTETSSAPSPMKATPKVAGIIMPATYTDVMNKLYQ